MRLGEHLITHIVLVTLGQGWGMERTITIQATGTDGAWCDGVVGSQVSSGVWVWAGTRQDDHRVTFLPLPAGARQILILAGTEVPMRWCPAGTFTMGSPMGELGRASDETPPHPVILTQGFWMGETEVTQSLWVAVQGSNPSSYRGDLRPVEGVDWNDCQTFLTSVTSTVDPGLGAVLPTEAQWEYAYRAGTTTALYNGTELTSPDHDANASLIAWYYCGITHDVGGKTANAWGFHDLAGNVWEWCADWYGPYPIAAVTDPEGPTSGRYRTNRGGCWWAPARYCRAAQRGGDEPQVKGGYLGFRFVHPGPRPVEIPLPDGTN